MQIEEAAAQLEAKAARKLTLDQICLLAVTDANQERKALMRVAQKKGDGIAASASVAPHFVTAWGPRAVQPRPTEQQLPRNPACDSVIGNSSGSIGSALGASEFILQPTSSASFSTSLPVSSDSANLRRYYTPDSDVEFEAQLRRNPNDIETWLQFASHLLHNGQLSHRLIQLESWPGIPRDSLDRCLHALSRALEANSSSAPIWAPYLRLYNERMGFDGAKDLFEQSVLYAPARSVWMTYIHTAPITKRADLCDRYVTELLNARIELGKDDDGNQEMLQYVLYACRLDILRGCARCASLRLGHALGFPEQTIAHVLPCCSCSNLDVVNTRKSPLSFPTFVERLNARQIVLMHLSLVSILVSQELPATLHDTGDALSWDVVNYDLLVLPWESMMSQLHAKHSSPNDAVAASLPSLMDVYNVCMNMLQSAALACIDGESSGIVFHNMIALFQVFQKLSGPSISATPATDEAELSSDSCPAKNTKLVTMQGVVAFGKHLLSLFPTSPSLIAALAFLEEQGGDANVMSALYEEGINSAKLIALRCVSASREESHDSREGEIYTSSSHVSEYNFESVLNHYFELTHAQAKAFLGQGNLNAALNVLCRAIEWVNVLSTTPSSESRNKDASVSSIANPKDCFGCVSAPVGVEGCADSAHLINARSLYRAFLGLPTEQSDSIEAMATRNPSGFSSPPPLGNYRCHQDPYLYLCCALFEELTVDAGDARVPVEGSAVVEVFESALEHVLDIGDRARVWQDYLLYVRSRIPSGSEGAHEAFRQLCNRCLTSWQGVRDCRFFNSVRL